MRKRSLASGAAAAAVIAVGALPAMAGPAQAAATPMCATSQLSASLGGGQGAAGNVYRNLVITNKGSATCHLTGYPGVSLLDGSGAQIGAPATRAPKTYAQVVLAPGASASSTLHTLNHHGTCRPASAQVRVYPPGNRASLVIPGQLVVCGNVFTVTPLAGGSGGNPGGSGGSTGGSTGGSSGGSSSGGQVSTVPSGAPETGVAAQSGSGDGPVIGAAAGSVAALAGAGVLLARRRRARD